MVGPLEEFVVEVPERRDEDDDQCEQLEQCHGARLRLRRAEGGSAGHVAGRSRATYLS